MGAHQGIAQVADYIEAQLAQEVSCMLCALSVGQPATPMLWIQGKET